jgi:hypothetical protein
MLRPTVCCCLLLSHTCCTIRVLLARMHLSPGFALLTTADEGLIHSIGSLLTIAAGVLL